MSSNRVLTLALLCAGLGGSLAACASDSASPARAAVNPAALYPLRAEVEPDQVALALHAEGLSAAQTQALAALAARWLRDGGEAITLRAPRGGADPALAARVQADARAVLAGLGVPPAAIRLATYDAADAKAPLLAAYPRYVAQVAACGRAWDDLTATRDNTVQSNFGCAVSANMAAQIANPADITRPRGVDAPDAQRRETVLGAYAAGKTTAAEDDPAKSGAISQVAR
jgi:pilus assembly protein CpaD